MSKENKEEKAKKPTLEEQMKTKRTEELVDYQNALSAASEKYGYKVEPRMTITNQGVKGEIQIVPTR